MTDAPDTSPTVDERNNPESRSAAADNSPGVARAGQSGMAPEAPDGRDAEGPDGTAAGDPLAGVLISDEDAAEAVAGDTGPVHPGSRGRSPLDRPV